MRFAAEIGPSSAVDLLAAFRSLRPTPAIISYPNDVRFGIKCACPGMLARAGAAVGSGGLTQAVVRTSIVVANGIRPVRAVAFVLGAGDGIDPAGG